MAVIPRVCRSTGAIGRCGSRWAAHFRSTWRGLRSQRGFSLVELLVVMLVASILTVAVLLFLQGTTRVFNSQEVRIQNQDDARTAVNQLTRYLRMATNSEDNGTTLSNAIATTLPGDVEFYCDVDGDTVAEKLRYYLVGNVLRSQSVDPEWVTGEHPYWRYGAYTTDGIVIENRVRNESNQPMFVYYRQAATGSLEQFSPATDVDRRQVVTVGIFIRVGARPDLAERDVYLSTEVQIRQRYTGGLDL
jgi:prepilin-type N-terminal cleavage/methylation domain-containing protein